MKKIRKISIAFLVIVLLLMVSANVTAKNDTFTHKESPARVESISADGKTATIYASKAESLAAMDYWTLERRQAAKPLPFPSDEVAVIEQENAQSLGTPGFKNGRLPDPAANISAQKSFPSEWAMEMGAADLSALNGLNDFGTAAVFTSYLTNYYTNMWKQYPYSAVGKLYISGGGYCSASVISTYTIVTAAHCVYDTGTNQWMSGWTFVPADRNGGAPYGTFGWKSAKILTNWMNASGTIRRYDVAVIQLYNNSAGRKVSYYTGWLGRAWNYGYIQLLHAQGYPSNLNSGRYTYTCAAESFSGGTNVLGMGCNMTYGSSGGPWIMSFQPNVTGYVNSVVSGGTPGTNTFYGARFASDNIYLLCSSFCY